MGSYKNLPHEAIALLGSGIKSLGYVCGSLEHVDYHSVENYKCFALSVPLLILLPVKCSFPYAVLTGSLHIFETWSDN